MTSRSELGQIGENIACRYLVENDYKLIERNFKKPWGEIDIVVKDKDKTLVFVEVKTVQQVSQNKYCYNSDKSEVAKHCGDFTTKKDFFVKSPSDQISAEDQLTRAKLTKIQRTASLYAGHRQELIDDKKGWRIDLLALTINGNYYVIKHYKNIVK